MDATAQKSDFDFLIGSWTIHNRRKQAKLLTDNPQGNAELPWEEFPAKHTGEKYLDGKAHIEHYEATFPNGQLVKGITIRAYDATKQEWLIGWLDNRQPPDFSPLVGRFENGVGTFYQVTEGADGKPLHVRFTWDNITATSARWQQAFSTDGGQTWDTNWIMDFTR